MSVDKFGRSSSSSIYRLYRKRQLFEHPRNTIRYTEDGNFDMENRKLCNVQDPIEETDVTTKKYADKLHENAILRIDKFGSVLTDAKKAFLKAEIDLSKKVSDLDNQMTITVDEIDKKWIKMLADYEKLSNRLKRLQKVPVPDEKIKRLQSRAVQSK
ncbi:hypothetical protein Zmor_027934 [Zophobas morio]|uniref:Uncharacterized protein n=1 Tax=Zophobas morio TaxID=2755281 RepID=A0AA38HRV6_9CUCU|nr:hypothetical protein Zmor_027934 [Zophobas morio]